MLTTDRAQRGHDVTVLDSKVRQWLLKEAVEVTSTEKNLQRGCIWALMDSHENILVGKETINKYKIVRITLLD